MPRQITDWHVFGICLVLIPIFWSVGSSAHELDTQAQYLGNEGILFTHGDDSALFDAFFEESYGQYVVPSAETSASLLNARPPFDGVKVIFVSHVHGDHFTAEPTVRYLQKHSQVKLFGSTQVVDRILALDKELEPRLESIALSPGEVPLDFDLTPFRISVVAIPHAGGERTKNIQNLAFRVSIDDSKTMVHLGDAGASLSVFNPLRRFFSVVDIAFPPYWFYLDEVGRDIIDNIIAAETTIGIHVPSKAMGQGSKMRQELGGDVFTDPGERRTFEP